MHQSADIDWSEGAVPVSARFGDSYYSGGDGLAEARHVYLGGNALPERFANGFHIAELGMGTGLNLLAALIAWRAAEVSGKLHYTGFEAWPMDAASMDRALSTFPEARAVAGPMLDAIRQGATHLQTHDLDAEIILGDARETVPCWAGRADAWFLDGFAPARNPEMWEPALLAAVGARTAPGGTCASFTAAGHVRRALEAAGFAVTRARGFGRKRHMTAGRLP